MSNEQLTLVCFIKAKQETKKTVKEYLMNLTESTRKEAGLINYDLHVSESDDSLFIIHENWRSKIALDSHMAQPYLKEFLAKQAEWLEKPLDVQFCKKIK